MTIGVIGQGYVGTAIKLGFQDHYKVLTYDKFDLAKSTHSKISDLVEETKVIFVCVPTPMRKDGTCYTGIVEEVIREINETANDHIVVIKSTVPPGTTDKFNHEFSNVTVIFNPEFLTEENFLDDFKNQNRIILGGSRKGTNKLRQIYSKVFPKAVIVKTGDKHAEMVKYFTNTFLATKVSFVSKKDNPGYYRLIKEFYKKTGCPMVLNTSLNIKGQPIVNDEKQVKEFTNKYGVKVF